MDHFQKATRTARLVVACCLVAAIVVATPAVVEACPTCKDAIAQNDPHHQQMVKGYYYSILFMMSMPFLVLSTFGSLAYLSIRRARSQNDTATAPPQPQ